MVRAAPNSSTPKEVFQEAINLPPVCGSAICSPIRNFANARVVVSAQRIRDLDNENDKSVRPTDGALFAAGREATTSQRGDIYRLSCPPKHYLLAYIQFNGMPYYI
jgi:hypothetical protein